MWYAKCPFCNQSDGNDDFIVSKETNDSKSLQCGFEFHWGYGRRGA